MLGSVWTEQKASKQGREKGRVEGRKEGGEGRKEEGRKEGDTGKIGDFL